MLDRRPRDCRARANNLGRRFRLLLLAHVAPVQHEGTRAVGATGCKLARLGQARPGQRSCVCLSGAVVMLHTHRNFARLSRSGGLALLAGRLACCRTSPSLPLLHHHHQQQQQHCPTAANATGRSRGGQEIAHSLGHAQTLDEFVCVRAWRINFQLLDKQRRLSSPCGRCKLEDSLSLRACTSCCVSEILASLTERASD